MDWSLVPHECYVSSTRNITAIITTYFVKDFIRNGFYIQTELHHITVSLNTAFILSVAHYALGFYRQTVAISHLVQHAKQRG